MEIKKFIKPYRKNRDTQVSRENYNVIKIDYTDFTSEMKKSFDDDLQKLIENANDLSANSGKIRDLNDKKKHAFIGVFAEYATVIMFNQYFSNCHARTQIVEEHNHDTHVDVELEYNENIYSVEVRSSICNNGIDFALFSKENKSDKQYFHVLGYYKNFSYKQEEVAKNLYIRALYDGKSHSFNDFNSFIKSFYEGELSVYIIGGVSRKLLESKGYEKELNKRDEDVQAPGVYKVVDLKEIIDVTELKNNFNKYSI